MQSHRTIHPGPRQRGASHHRREGGIAINLIRKMQAS